ncbi:conjugal transfer protein [Streptomyces sp. NPDC087300]|uniref:conjugal transfer protein n=1 Tax=Streptomyces sp. NPDC087300 TaxID=3365780 RepID=UPI0037F7BDAB
MYVAAYAQAGQGGEAALAPFFPGARGVALDAKAGMQRAGQLAAVRVQKTSPRAWSVTVAAHLSGVAKKKTPPPAEDQEPPGGVLRYFQVSVIASSAGGGYVAAALPAEVAAPGPGEEVELGYGAAVPADKKDPATAAVGEFLASYLTGAGELDRYLSPGTALNAVSPAPYTELEVDQLAERGSDFRTGLAADEGVRRELRVDVNATDRAGQTRPLTYALALTARDGRWEISALTAASAAGATVKGNQ